jgi:hypothetical protein
VRGVDLFTPQPKRWRSVELVALLRARYPKASHALFEQVANATGASHRRSADALVLELWPSDGLHLLGFEVKVSRGDWRRELRQPRKAEAISRYCDTWWVVAPEGVVGPSELPPGWGLLEPQAVPPPVGAGALAWQLRQRVAAVQVDPRPALDRAFVAALMRAGRVEVPPDVRKTWRLLERLVDARPNCYAGRSGRRCGFCAWCRARRYLDAPK